MGSRVNCLTLDNVDNLWIGTNSDLQFFDGYKMTKYSQYVPEGATVNAIGIDKDKRVWVCTSSGVLIKADESWMLLTKGSDYDLLDNDNKSITRDGAGRMWLGTISGIQVGNAFSYYAEYFSSNMNLGREISDYIQDIAVDKKGIIWAVHKTGAKKGGITRFDGLNWSLFNFTGIYSGSYIETNKIYIDKNNNKWFCTNDGLFRYSDTNEWIYFSTSNSGLPASQVMDCSFDKNENLWIITLGGGLAKLKKGNF